MLRCGKIGTRSGSGHDIQLELPQLITRAVRELLGVKGTRRHATSHIRCVFKAPHRAVRQ
jgi:hypothetical protein